MPRNLRTCILPLALSVACALPWTSVTRADVSQAAPIQNAHTQSGAALAEHPKVAAALTLLDLWIEEQRAHRGIPGLSIGIVQGQELLWAKGYGVADLDTGAPAAPDTLYRIGSVTKLFTSTAILQLRDRGLLRLDDPVARHLPWFAIQSPFEDVPEITIRHLLTHTSGLPREGAFPYWTTHDFPTREELIAALPGQTAIFPPGERYKYSNLGMTLLGEVVAAVSGTTWAEFVESQIFAPLGMDHSRAAPDAETLERLATAYLRQRGGQRQESLYYETRAVAPAAQIVSSVVDLARFAVLHLAEAPADGPVLRPATVREMHRPHWVRDDWSGGRGLGFAVSRRGGTTYVAHGGWVGGHRTHFLLVPDEDLAVIVVTNADDASPTFFGRRAYDAVAPALAAATAAPAQPKVADPAWDRYLGTYTDPWGWEARAMVLDGQLVLYEHSYPPDDDPDGSVTPLEPAGEHTFRMGDGETVVFELDDDGRVQRLRKRYEYLTPVRDPEP